MSSSDRAKAGERVCLGAIAGPHGLKGAVLIKTFTANAEDIGSYGPLRDEAGDRIFDVCVDRTTKKGVVARLAGISTRVEAEGLKGTRLYVDRDRLPETTDQDEFYQADLIGLTAETADGPMGKVLAVHNFGAGDILEISIAGGKPVMIRFTKESVPEVDMDKGRILVVLDKAGEDSDPDGAENPGPLE